METTDGARLRLALGQLSEQDPLIDVRQDERHELSVSLYGEVQKEVIQATLASDYGLDVTFRETTVICVERPVGIGEAAEVLHAESNPFAATIGLRIEPAPVGSGVEFRTDVDPRSAPLYVYKTFEAFGQSMAGYVRDALREGLAGWQVADCVVTMNRCTYQSPDGSAATRGPLSTAADFRKLTPIVVSRRSDARGPMSVSRSSESGSRSPPPPRGRHSGLGVVSVRWCRRRPWTEAVRPSRRSCPRPASRSYGGSCRR